MYNSMHQLTNSLALSFADGILGQTRAVETAVGSTLAATTAVDVRLALLGLGSLDNTRASALLKHHLLWLELVCWYSWVRWVLV